jgi:hypothetical protein
MTVLVVVETLLIVLMGVLVASLLRSHAEILRRLDELSGASGEAFRPVAVAPGDPPPEIVDRGPNAPAAAADLAGSDLRGNPLQVGVAGASNDTLLAFLTSGCLTCRSFWEAFQPAVRPAMPGAARLVVVTKDAAFESTSKLRELAPPDLTVVMSSAAWEGYGVPASPYFVYVEGSSGRIVGEGTAGAWPQVLSLLHDAVSDAAIGATEPGMLWTSDGGSWAGGRGARDRAERVDQELDGAGIGAGDPSLYAPGDPVRGANGPPA